MHSGFVVAVQIQGGVLFIYFILMVLALIFSFSSATLPIMDLAPRRHDIGSDSTTS